MTMGVLSPPPTTVQWCIRSRNPWPISDKNETYSMLVNQVNYLESDWKLLSNLENCFQSDFEGGLAFGKKKASE